MPLSISSVLEKMKSHDKDFRYMATSDLIAEMDDDNFMLEASVQRQLVDQVLALLDDNSNDVQEVAARCLGPLVANVASQHVVHIFEVLAGHLLDDDKKKDELRDISSIGLKTVMAKVDADDVSVPKMVGTIAPRLIEAVPRGPSRTPQQEVYVLELLGDIVQKYGAQLTEQHAAIQNVLTDQLVHKRQASRKRAINATAALAAVESDKLFKKLVEYLSSHLKSAKKSEHVRGLIQCVASISQAVGYRIGKYLGKLVPLVLKYCEDERFESDDELRENCFQCFEALVERCPNEVVPHLDDIEKTALKFIKYDPNYAVDEDDEDDEEDAMDMDDDEEVYDDDEDYSDDDDMSWKVRRSATKCLQRMIESRPERIEHNYEKVAPVLISRLREREDNVKVDVVHAVALLLRKSRQLNRLEGAAAADSAVTKALKSAVPSLVTATARQLKDKSPAVRVALYQMLKELVAIMPGLLAEHFGALVAPCEFSLAMGREKDSNSNLKIEVLGFLRAAVHAHEPSVFQPHLEKLLPAVLKQVNDEYYRIAAEGLRLLNALIAVIRPADGDAVDVKPFVGALSTALLGKLEVQDIDQSVKESAILCTGRALAVLGDQLEASTVEKALALLMERLRNEITRLHAVNALREIAASSLSLDLSAVIGDAMKELATLLRQANRQLRQAVLECLTVVAKKHGKSKACYHEFKECVQEAAPVVSGQDLHLSHLALRFACTVVEVHSKSAEIVADKLLPSALKLLSDALLQGAALDSLCALYKALVKAHSKSVSFDKLYEPLLATAAQRADGTELNKQTAAGIARCAATLACNAKDEKRDATVAALVKALKKSESESDKLLNLLIVGEIGRRADISAQSGLQKCILASFDGGEELKHAASFALGNVAVGALDKYVPFILAEIADKPKRQYLLLHSLREVIARLGERKSGAKHMKAFRDDIVKVLLTHAAADEEGTRNVVSECLGHLCVLAPAELTKVLGDAMGDKNAHVRATAITALKFMVSDGGHSIDAQLGKLVPQLLAAISDKSIDVRKASLLALNYLAHTRAALVRDELGAHLDALYAEAKVKPELVRVVELGPFKHKVDDGLETRKSAYECMYTLLSTCIDRLDIAAFVAHLVPALADQHDIAMLGHLMIVRLALMAPLQLVERLDALVEPLDATVSAEAKEGAVKQEAERNDELVRSALRAVRAVQRIPASDSSTKFTEFLAKINATPELHAKYEQIDEDKLGASLTASQGAF